MPRRPQGDGYNKSIREIGAICEFARKHSQRVLFYQYVQWQIDVQLGAAQQRSRERGLSIGRSPAAPLPPPRHRRGRFGIVCRQREPA